MATWREAITDSILAAAVTIAAAWALGAAIELTRLTRLTRRAGLDLAVLTDCFGGGPALGAFPVVTTSTATAAASAPAAAAFAGLFTGVGRVGLGLYG